MKNDRLLSLDVLRGADLFMLVALQPVLRSLLLALNNETLNGTLLAQLDHAPWEGFRAWDLVMPLFLFMSGVTMPFSLPKYLKQNNNLKVWKRVLKRVAMLFALGMLVQGNILSLDPSAIYIYSNTLQAIAIGYLLTVPMVLYLRPQWQVAAIAMLLLVYTSPMTLWGECAPQDNFACAADKLILGRFRDGTTIAPDGSLLFAPWYDYTWIWSSLTFCCTVAMGSIAGTIIKSGNNNRKRVATTLLVTGVALIAAGLLWDAWQPMIKRVWNGSMTIFSGGLCYTLLAIFYWWIDVKGHRKGWNWLLYYGCNAITAYLIGEMINFRSIARSLLHGTEQYIGSDMYSVLLTAANYAIIFFIMRLLYKNRIFLKV